MRFSEKWRIAGIIASEMRFKSFLEANPGNLARVKEDPEQVQRQIRSSARISTFFTTMIVFMLTVISIAATVFDEEIGAADIRMAMGLSLFLIMSFVIVFFMNLMSATGFFTSGSMEFALTLPLERSELEGLAVLAFSRVFIAPAILIITVFPTVTLLFYGPFAAIVALIGCASTVILSIHALIAFAKWFYVKTHTADSSRLSGFIRIATSLGLVIGMLSVYSLSSYIPALIDFIGSVSSTLGAEAYVVLSLIFPFAFGFLASSLAFGTTFTNLALWTSLAGTALYGIASLVAFRKSGANLRAVVTGGLPSTDAEQELKEVSLEIRTPLMALARKDLKLATRNIGSAFLFAIPVFLVIALAPILAEWQGAIRSMTAIIAISYANLFSGISLVGIMMFDTQGASIHAGLPMSTKLSLRTKSAIAFVPYIFSMLFVAILLLLNTPIVGWIPVMAIVQIPSGYAIGMVVGGAIYKIRGGGRAVAVNLTSDQAIGFMAAIVGVFVGSVPLIFYSIGLLLTGLHLLSLALQLIGVVVLLVIASRFIPKLLVD